MLQVDPEILRAFRTSIVRDVRANIYDGTALAYEGLKIVGGTVTADRESTVRRQLQSCTIALHEWEEVPLNVVTSRVQIWMGLDVAGFPVDLPLGVFRIDKLSRVDRGLITVEGSSFESYLIENLYHGSSEDIQFKAGYNIVLAVQDLVRSSFEDATFEITAGVSVNKTLDRNFTMRFQESYWEAAHSLVNTHLNGCVMYCTPAGDFRITPDPKFVGTEAVARLDEGPDGVLIQLSTSVSRDDVYNAVVAMFQSTDSDSDPMSYVAIDRDPDSPTYYGGAFGKRVLFLDAEDAALVDSNDLKTYLKNKAETELERRRFPERELDLSAVPNPALEPDDVIQVTMLDGTVENHMIKTLSFPLASGEWTATTISTKVAADADPDSPQPPPTNPPLPPADPDTDPDPDADTDVEEEDSNGNPTAPSDPPADPPTAAVATITATTFNSLYKLPNTKRRQDIVRLINTERPSVIGLQESGGGVRSTYIDVAQQNNYGFYQPMRTDANARATTPIMWDKNVWDVQAKGKIQLSPKTRVGATSGISVVWQAQKHIIWVRLRHKQTGTIWTFASVHFVAQKGRSRARMNLYRKQAANLYKWLTRSSFKGKHVVVLGDFNGSPTDRELRKIRSVAKIQHAVSRRKGTRIDHVYSMNVRTVSVKNMKNVNSDHFPITATLRSR